MADSSIHHDFTPSSTVRTNAEPFEVYQPPLPGTPSTGMDLSLSFRSAQYSHSKQQQQQQQQKSIAPPSSTGVSASNSVIKLKGSLSVSVLAAKGLPRYSEGAIGYYCNVRGLSSPWKTRTVTTTTNDLIWNERESFKVEAQCRMSVDIYDETHQRLVGGCDITVHGFDDLPKAKWFELLGPEGEGGLVKIGFLFQPEIPDFTEKSQSVQPVPSVSQQQQQQQQPQPPQPQPQPSHPPISRESSRLELPRAELKKEDLNPPSISLAPSEIRKVLRAPHDALPPAPIISSVRAVTTDPNALLISWEMPGSGRISNITGYRLFTLSSDSTSYDSGTEISLEEGREFVIRNLNRSCRYRLRVCCRNPNGLGALSEPTAWIKIQDVEKQEEKYSRPYFLQRNSNELMRSQSPSKLLTTATESLANIVHHERYLHTDPSLRPVYRPGPANVVNGGGGTATTSAATTTATTSAAAAAAMMSTFKNDQHHYVSDFFGPSSSQYSFKDPSRPQQQQQPLSSMKPKLGAAVGIKRLNDTNIDTEDGPTAEPINFDITLRSNDDTVNNSLNGSMNRERLFDFNRGPATASLRSLASSVGSSKKQGEVDPSVEPWMKIIKSSNPASRISMRKFSPTRARTKTDEDAGGSNNSNNDNNDNNNNNNNYSNSRQHRLLWHEPGKRRKLFPLMGIVLGQSPMSKLPGIASWDASSGAYEDKPGVAGFPAWGMQFWGTNSVVTRVRILAVTLERKELSGWMEDVVGVSNAAALSYDDWLKWMAVGLELDGKVVVAPCVLRHGDTAALHAEVVGYSPWEKVEVRLEFGYAFGKTEVTDRGTLHSIDVAYKPENDLEWDQEVFRREVVKAGGSKFGFVLDEKENSQQQNASVIGPYDTHLITEPPKSSDESMYGLSSGLRGEIGKAGGPRY